jgi:REP element-mobilizing transposase RayT
VILAHHIIFAAYGFWLPNDPRGSWSEVVRAWELLRFGEATKVTTRRSLAHSTHDVQLRLAAKRALRYEPVTFSGEQALEISRGFQMAMRRSGFVLHACAILPEHVHVVVGRHRIHGKQIMNQLKGEASKALARAGLHPFQEVFLPRGCRHMPWAEKGWTVYLNSEEEVHRAVVYVQKNPTKEGLAAQKWGFVTPYRGWGSGAALRRR